MSKKTYDESDDKEHDNHTPTHGGHGWGGSDGGHGGGTHGGHGGGTHGGHGGGTHGGHGWGSDGDGLVSVLNTITGGDNILNAATGDSALNLGAVFSNILNNNGVDVDGGNAGDADSNYYVTLGEDGLGGFDLGLDDIGGSNLLDLASLDLCECLGDVLHT